MISKLSGWTGLLLAVAIGVVACGDDDDSGSGGGAGSNGAAGSGLAGSNLGGSNAGGSNVGGSNAGGSSAGSSSCDGDFSLGQNAVTSGDTSTFGQACNGPAPTNCPDGTFINLSNGQCVCSVMCSAVQVQIGQSCNGDGSVVCAKVVANNGNFATLCTSNQWNLCTSGGAAGAGNGGSAGSSAGSSNTGGANSGGSSSGSSSCTPSGGECFDNDECCSGTCDLDTCQ